MRLLLAGGIVSLMVAINPSTRQVTYEPVASAGPFPVGDPAFPVFDPAGADLRVTLDGLVVTNWTFSGTNGAGFYGAPNTWLNGSILFDAPVTGTLVIKGRRVPRRQLQYAEGRGIPARDHNTDLNILTAVTQELRRDIDGFVLGQEDIDAAVAAADADRIAAETARDEAEAAAASATAALPARFVSSIPALQALVTPDTLPNAFVTSDTLIGRYQFQAGDKAAAVAADGEFFTVESDAIAAGLGAWIKVVKQGPVRAREDLGLTGIVATDGDATDKLQWAALRGPILLEHGAEYSFSEQIAILDGGGILPYGRGGAKPLLTMNPTGFNATTYAPAIDAINVCGINALSKTNVRLAGFKLQLDATASVRTVTGIAMRGCTDSEIVGVEATGFKEGTGRGVITLDSLTRCRVVDNYIYDCGANSNALASYQITGISCDADRVSSVFSRGLQIARNRIDNMFLGALAFAVSNYQTDGIQFGNPGDFSDIRVHDNYISRVHEGIDTFAVHGHIFRNFITEVLVGIKIGNGSERLNVADNLISGTVGPGIILYGGPVLQDVAYHKIHGNIGRAIGDVTAIHGIANTSPFGDSFIVTDGASGTYVPRRNEIYENQASGGAMPYVVNLGAGTLNRCWDNTAPNGTSSGQLELDSVGGNYLSKRSRTANGSGLSNLSSAVFTETIVVKGDHVRCYGLAALTASGAGGCVATLALVHARAFSSGELVGVGSVSTGEALVITGSGSNAEVSFTATGAGLRTFRYSYEYNLR